MPVYKIDYDLTPNLLGIYKIFLDPQNPRFADEERYEISSDEDFTSETVQKQLLKINTNYAIEELKSSIELNGYLPIDRVIVKRIKEVKPIKEEDKYIVLEGNRRITAIKLLLKDHKEGKLHLSKEVLDSLQEIPVLIYKGEDTDAAWLFQGLRHISGIRNWSALNKAKLVAMQIENSDVKVSYTEIGKIFGLSARAAGQYFRAYRAFQQAREHPDFSTLVDARAFPFFHELFGQSCGALRNWLQWDDNSLKFIDMENFETFLAWLYPKDKEDEEYVDEYSGLGNWENRRIPRAIDLRDVSKLVGDGGTPFHNFLNNGDLSKARYMLKEEESYEAGALKNELNRLRTSIVNMPVIAITEEQKAEEFINVLDEIIKSANSAKTMLSKCFEEKRNI